MRTSLFVAIVIMIGYVVHYTASVYKYLCSVVGDVFATNPAGRLDLVLTASL